MKEIKLTQGLVALVDDEDFERVNHFKWCAHKHGKTFYARRAETINGKQKIISMHCFIMNTKGIDHVDGDGLNCQKLNMRKCTHQHNIMNQRPQKNKSSIYKGVCIQGAKWRSGIMFNKKGIYLGLFVNEMDAAKTYDKKAVELFGEYARLNFPI